MEMNWTEIDWGLVLEGVAYVLAIIFFAFVIPWLKAKYGTEKVNQAMTEFKQTWENICILVQAAEQKFPKIDDVKTGDKKKTWVKEQMVGVYGIEVTPKEDAMIEAAVYELIAE